MTEFLICGLNILYIDIPEREINDMTFLLVFRCPVYSGDGLYCVNIVDFLVKKESMKFRFIESGL